MPSHLIPRVGEKWQWDATGGSVEILSSELTPVGDDREHVSLFIRTMVDGKPRIIVCSASYFMQYASRAEKAGSS